MKKTGDEYFDSEEFREMLATYEEAVNTGQPVFLDADELAEIADFYQMTEQYDEADDAIELALSLSPGAIAPLTYKIHEALWNGDTEEARDYLDQIIEIDEPDYVYDKAEILMAEEREEECEAYLREELQKVPADEYQDYVIDVANLWADYNYPEKAMEWMSRARQEDTPEFKELMGRTLFGLGKYKDSQRIFNELIDTNPFSKYYWNALASAQLMDEDFNNAIQSSEYAIALDPKDPDGLIAKANALFRLNNYEEALEYFRRYSEEVPDDELALLHQGTCLINLERNEEAIEVLQEAVTMSIDRDDYIADIYQELAFAYSETGETDKAIDYLNMTDTLNCDHVQTEVVKGHILLSDGRMEEAEEHFKKAVGESEEPLVTLLRVIVSIYDNRYLEAAYALFTNYFRVVPPGHKDGYAYMALCCYELKHYTEFLEYLKKACTRNPKECKLVLGHIFPDELDAKDYYAFLQGKMTPPKDS